MDSLIEERRFNPAPKKKLGYIYYEVTITKGKGNWNKTSTYNMEIGFAHFEDSNCGKYLCKICLDLDSFERNDTLIIGCWYDWVSNVVLFTRNGKSLGSPYYVGPPPDTCK